MEMTVFKPQIYVNITKLQFHTKNLTIQPTLMTPQSPPWKLNATQCPMTQIRWVWYYTGYLTNRTPIRLPTLSLSNPMRYTNCQLNLSITNRFKIVYLSISHMGQVIAASIIQTFWSFSGAIILIIYHRLTSSILFCLANTNYKCPHSWILILTWGLQPLPPLKSYLTIAINQIKLTEQINDKYCHSSGESERIKC